MASAAGQTDMNDMKQDFTTVLTESLATHVNFWNTAALLGGIDELSGRDQAKAEQLLLIDTPPSAMTSELSGFRPERPVSAPVFSTTQGHNTANPSPPGKVKSDANAALAQGVYAAFLPEGVMTPPESSSEQISWSASPGRICHNCHTTQTPFWRRWGDGLFYCNACGLYLRTHNRMRPQKLQESRLSKRNKPRVDVCKNCQARETPLWRKIATGETVCNACGLYYRLHNAHRPLSLGKASSVSSGISMRAAKQRLVLPKLTSVSGWHHYQAGELGLSRNPSASNPASPRRIPRFEQNNGSLFIRGLAPPGAAERSSPDGAASRIGSMSHSWPSVEDSNQPFPSDLIHFALIQSLAAAGHMTASSGPDTISNLRFVERPGLQTENEPISLYAEPNYQRQYSQPTMITPEPSVRADEEDSLDDSMRWFSSTCLETAFSRADQ